MNSLENDLKAGLFESSGGPCLSLYQPTHRHYPENRQDPIRFRNLVKGLKESLLRKYPAQEIQPLLDPFLALADDRDFWNHTLDGLAVLGSGSLFRTYRLQRPFAELVVVADRFHTKPLMSVLQTSGRYQVLGLSRKGIRLFEGNRDALDEVELARGVPRTMIEALGEEVTEPHTTVASYGGTGASHVAMHHGHGGKESEVEIDTERFFRAVDSAILEHHTRPSALPLILATLPEHRPMFHKLSRNPFLMDEGIGIHPDAIPIDELRQRAWQVVEPHYLARLASRVDEFETARSKGLGHEDVADVAKAVVAGRVALLLLEADREVPGRIDSVTGDIEAGDLADPEVGDVLGDLGTLALKMGGQVEIVPAALMPAATGTAAIYRY